LKNWREYLDWEIQNGTHERVVVLFERCMIACALYEDFWMKVKLFFILNHDFRESLTVIEVLFNNFYSGVCEPLIVNLNFDVMLLYIFAMGFV
jgi:hypothetical protein